MSHTITVTTQNFQEEVLDFQGVVLVDFYADWCMPCKALAPELEKIAEGFQMNTKVKIAKLNTEDSMEIAQEYQIRGIPNVIIFNNGQKIQQLVGLRPKNDYEQIINEELEKESAAEVNIEL